MVGQRKFLALLSVSSLLFFFQNFQNVNSKWTAYGGQVSVLRDQSTEGLEVYTFTEAAIKNESPSLRAFPIAPVKAKTWRMTAEIVQLSQDGFAAEISNGASDALKKTQVGSALFNAQGLKVREAKGVDTVRVESSVVRNAQGHFQLTLDVEFPEAINNLVLRLYSAKLVQGGLTRDYTGTPGRVFIASRLDYNPVDTDFSNNLRNTSKYIYSCLNENDLQTGVISLRTLKGDGVYSALVQRGDVRDEVSPLKSNVVSGTVTFNDIFKDGTFETIEAKYFMNSLIRDPYTRQEGMASPLYTLQSKFSTDFEGVKDFFYLTKANRNYPSPFTGQRIIESYYDCVIKPSCESISDSIVWAKNAARVTGQPRYQQILETLYKRRGEFSCH